MIKPHRIITMCIITICFICAGTVALTIEKNYEMDLCSGRIRISISMLNFTILSTIRETRLSRLMKLNSIDSSQSDCWVLDSSYSILMRQHSPHWQYHGIISSYDTLVQIITYYSVYHKWDVSTVRTLLSTALEKDRDYGRPISSDILSLYVTRASINPSKIRDVLKLQEFIKNTFKTINTSAELDKFIKNEEIYREDEKDIKGAGIF